MPDLWQFSTHQYQLMLIELQRRYRDVVDLSDSLASGAVTISVTPRRRNVNTTLTAQMLKRLNISERD